MYRFTEKSIGPAYRAIDTAVAVSSLLLVLVLLNLPHDARQLGSFLETRITLKNVLLIATMTLMWPAVFNAFGLYRFAELASPQVELSRVAPACLAGSSFAFVLALTTATGAFGFGAVLLFLFVVTTATVGARATGRWILSSLGGINHIDHILIAGTGPRGQRHYRQLSSRKSQCVIGFIDTGPTNPLFPSEEPPFLGTIADLEQLLVSREIDAVHICLPVKSCYAAIAEVIGTCERVGVESRYEADIFPRSLARPVTGEFDLVVAMKVVADDYRLGIKRLIDIAGALIALVAFLPILLAAAVAVRSSTPGPILFRQERFGFNRRRFRMYKFRTMVIDAEARQPGLEHRNHVSGPVFKIRDDPRVTSVGRFLRRTSIDELPQLFNVLIGEMSLVGPRPLPVRDVSRFTEGSLMRRFSVKPGLTCLWQINGRSDTSFEEWIQQDLEYIDRWSLGLDLSILARTIPAVLKGSGAA